MTKLTPGSTPSYDDLKAALFRKDAGAADILIALYGDSIRYDHSADKWYLWRGQFWQLDAKREVVRLVSHEVSSRFLSLAAHFRGQGDKHAGDASKLAMELCQQRTVDAVLRNARTHPMIALDGSEWDANPLLLGTQSGVVDLRTGNLLPVEDAKAALIRSVAAVAWEGLNAPAPQWEAFVSAILGNDCELLEAVQRVLGYGITGLVIERIFAILYGIGANGKTTLQKILTSIMGTALTMQADARALMQSERVNPEGARPFLRNLQSKRLVFASEAQTDAELDPSLIKWATGNDPITARALNENPVQFNPSHLLLFATNDKPKVPANDQALWDRLRLIPFTQRFVDNPDAQRADEHPRDATLVDRLPLEEGPGILAWLVRGCLAWQMYGLKDADAITKAGLQYRADAKSDDAVGAWITDKCEEDSSFKEQPTPLFQSWELWAKLNGISDTHSVIWLGRELQKRGYQKESKQYVNYLGLRLIPAKQGNP